MTFRFPFLRPHPVPLSEHADALRAIEDSQHYTNFGPVNRELETELVETLFAGAGTCCTVSNATLGLILALKLAQHRAGSSIPRFAILPSFTFAATAHAALWCNLEPLFCDVDAETWLPDLGSIQRLLRSHGPAVVVPYATFGNNLDIAELETLGAPVVIDAAASLGSRGEDGRQFGAGSRFPVVYSMHATKTFAASEAGLVYAADGDLVAGVRQMSNFGFDAERHVTMPGLNAKLSEAGALQALLKLRELDRVLLHRATLVESYRAELRGFVFQRQQGAQQAFQFLPARLAGATRAQRDRFIALAAAAGLEVRAYFSPPLHEQAFFAKSGTALPVTEAIAADVVSLPLYDSMTVRDVREIASIANDAGARALL